MYRDSLMKIAHFKSTRQVRNGPERRAQTHQTERAIMCNAGQA